jgi:hypothetical protein
MESCPGPPQAERRKGRKVANLGNRERRLPVGRQGTQPGLVTFPMRDSDKMEGESD